MRANSTVDYTYHDPAENFMSRRQLRLPLDISGASLVREEEEFVVQKLGRSAINEHKHLRLHAVGQRDMNFSTVRHDRDRVLAILHVRAAWKSDGAHLWLSASDEVRGREMI